MKTVLLLFLILFSLEGVQATHLIGGYIQATPISGLSLTYRISAVLYLDEVNGKAATNQASSIDICLGDGTTITAIQSVAGGLVTATAAYLDTDFQLTTFPGPVDDRLQVVIQTSTLTSPTVEMTDINGRIIHKLVFNRVARQHEQIIGMGSMTPGVYILRVSIGERSISRKIMKR